MRRLREIPAILALLGLCLPWARVVAVSAHLSSELEQGQPGHGASDLEDSFHGHHHDQGDQDHQHALITVDLVARRAKVIDGVLAPALAPWILGVASLAWPGDHPTLLIPGITDSGHGPPGISSRRTILRV